MAIVMMPTPAEARRALVARALDATHKSFRAFVTAFPPHQPYYWASHTCALARTLAHAHDALIRGESTYTIVIMPPRHGKSDLASRRFAPWVLYNRPETEIILASYSGNLATDMSHAARRCALEVGVKLDEARGRIEAWRTTAGGGLYAVGLGGTITGRGAEVLVIDDYLKGREEAESSLIRDKIWDSFQNDLLTRLAPAHAVVIPCTRWHEDDLVGRIAAAQADDSAFPHFKVLRFSAQGEDGSWLFPERFSAEWYERQRAAVGSYAWQALYQGDPQPRRGNLLRADMVDIIEPQDFPDGELRWARGWDLASTSKERMSDDPDYTVGLRAGLRDGHLYISDLQRGQWTAGVRDARIESVAVIDGPAVRIGIETVAGYKDTATRLRQSLLGRAHVESITPDRDKVARASALEPLFEAGRVHLKRAAWNADFLNECRAFPAGRHDDIVDGLGVAYRVLTRPMATVVRL